MLVWSEVWHKSMQDSSSLHFTFDKVHGPPDGAANTQGDIFSDIQDIVLSTLGGLNGCIMAYGQAGKLRLSNAQSCSPLHWQGVLFGDLLACYTQK